VPCYTGPPQQADIEGARKEERHTREGRKISRKKDKEATVYGRKEVSVNDEDEESMEWRNNVRYLRMNWIDVTTECQVQFRIIRYWGSPVEIIRNPKEQH
jgi:hypothetical protein